MRGIERFVGREFPRRWVPFPGIRGLQDEVNQLFGEFLGERVPLENPAFLPAVDLIDGKEAVTVKAELPGMRKEDVEVSLKDDLLTLKGEKKAEREEKGENRYYVERSYGSFSRTLRLPCKVQGDKVKAAFRDGVLEVTLPKAEEAKTREVRVGID